MLLEVEIFLDNADACLNYTDESKVIMSKNKPGRGKLPESGYVTISPNIDRYRPMRDSFKQLH